MPEIHHDRQQYVTEVIAVGEDEASGKRRRIVAVTYLDIM
jgi:hypothetical protein